MSVLILVELVLHYRLGVEGSDSGQTVESGVQVSEHRTTHCQSNILNAWIFMSKDNLLIPSSLLMFFEDFK